MNLLKALANTDWGAERKTLLMLYKSLIRSKIDYGCIVYGNAAKSNLRILETLHNSAIRLSIGAFRTSPITSILAESGEPSLQLRREQLTLNYANKVSAETSHPAFKPIFSTPEPNSTNILLNKYNITYMQDTLPITYGSIPPWIIPEPKINLELSEYNKENTHPTAYKIMFHELSKRYSTYRHVYTDASKFGSENDVGSAYYCEDDNTTAMFRLPNITSIYTAELYGILQALKYIENHAGKQFTINTDSLSALKSIHKIYPTHPLLTKIQETLYKIYTKSKKVVFIWIPSHVGIIGNEKADESAKLAATTETIPKEKIIVHQDTKTKINEEIKTKWQAEWTTIDNNKLRQIKPTINPWPTIGNRREATVITRLRIGHTKLTHKYLLDKKAQEQCNTCKKPITVEHIITECCKYNQQRTNNKITNNLPEVLKNDKSAVKNILNYLKNINLFNEI